MKLGSLDCNHTLAALQSKHYDVVTEVTMSCRPVDAVIIRQEQLCRLTKPIICPMQYSQVAHGTASVACHCPFAAWRTSASARQGCCQWRYHSGVCEQTIPAGSLMRIACVITLVCTTAAVCVTCLCTLSCAAGAEQQELRLQNPWTVCN